MIEFRILDGNTTPPGGWQYVQPESGRIFKHYSRDAFFGEIQSHRLANGYEITSGLERADRGRNLPDESAVGQGGLLPHPDPGQA